MKRIALAALAALGLLAPAAAHAVTFYSGMDAAITDSAYATVAGLSIPRPAFGDSVLDPMTGAKLKRITGATGAAIPGITGGTPKWGADARHHYSKDQPWSADEKYYWVENSVDPSKIIFDSLGVVKWTNKSTMAPYCACLDSSYEIRMHPRFANIVVGFVKDKGSTVHNKLIWWTLDSCKTKRSWKIPVGYPTSVRNDSTRWGLISEGTVSDDGRWIALGTSYKRETSAQAAANILKDDSLVVVDMMFPENRTGDLLAPDTLGGRVGTVYKVPRLPAAFTQPGTGNDHHGAVGNINISTKGTYAYLKYEGVPEYGRVFHRGTEAGADTSVLTLWPHTMAAEGLRSSPIGSSARDSTLGWVACMSHADMNETTSGVEVVAGHLRTVDDGEHNQDWDENTSTGDGVNASRDSGSVVMIELATGLHRHVSAGSRVTGTDPSTYEAEGQHSSGRSVGMRGWHFVSYAYSNPKTGTTLTRPYRGELAAWKLDGNFSTTHPSHTVIRFGQHRSSESPYRAESHFVPSPTGRRGMFVSDWLASNTGGDETSGGVGGDVKSYVLDLRTTGTREMWLDDNGTTGATGLASSHPSRTFAALNRVVTAGNGSNVIVRLAPGNYPDFPNPAYTPTGGKRYTITGHDISDPDRTHLATAGAAVLAQSGVSIKGVTIDGDLTLGSAVFDSLTNFIASYKLTINGLDRSVLADGEIRGAQFLFQRAGTDLRATKDTLVRLTFTDLNAPPNQDAIGWGSSSPARWVDSLYYADNVHTIRNNNTRSSWANDHLMRSTLLRNKWLINQTHAAPLQPAVFLRDSCAGNLFQQDSILAYGAGVNRIAWVYNGNAAQLHSVVNNTIDRCYLLTRNGPALDFSGGKVERWNIKGTVAVSSGAQAMRVGSTGQPGTGGFVGKNYIDHNTLASDHVGYRVEDLGVVGFDRPFAGAIDTVRFTNNLIYSFRPGGVGTDSTAGVGVNLMSSDTSYAGFGNEQRLRRWFVSDWNAIAVYRQTAAPGDRAIGYARSVAPGLSFAKAGASTGWNTLFAGRDVASVYGSPRFDSAGPDSVFGLNTSGAGTPFDPTLGFGSIASARDSSGGDIGAVAGPAVPIVMVSGESFTTPGAQATDTVTFVVSNIGNDTLTVTSDGDNNLVQITVGGEGSIAATLAPGASTEVRALVDGQGETVAEYTFTFTTDDPARPKLYLRLALGHEFQHGGTGGRTQRVSIGSND